MRRPWRTPGRPPLVKGGGGWAGVKGKLRCAPAPAGPLDPRPTALLTLSVVPGRAGNAYRRFLVSKVVGCQPFSTPERRNRSPHPPGVEKGGRIGVKEPPQAAGAQRSLSLTPIRPPHP